MKTKSPKTLQAEYAKDTDKIAQFGASRDADGKILICVNHENEGAMAYFFDAYQNKRRIFTSTFYRLLDEGKAVRVEPDVFDR